MEGDAAQEPGDSEAFGPFGWDGGDSLASGDDDGEDFDFEIDDDDEFELEVEDGESPDFLDDLFGVSGDAPAPEAAPEPEPEGSPDADAIDLRPEQRMAIDLAFDGIDDKSFYEILLLPRTADQRAVKRAYYRLSKEYHPDKFYRKTLGPYKVKLEVIFNKITEAYRILQDEDSRADYDDLVFGKEGKDAATLTEASTTVDFIPDAVRKRQANQEAKAKAKDRKGKKKKKNRAVFMQKFQKQLVMRIAKAKRHMAAGEAAMEKGDFQEAASNFQMAMTLDPRNTRAKTLFKRSQSQHRNGRAEEFYRQAQEVMIAEDTKRAAELLQKAVDCKPTKGKYYHEFGKLVIAHTLQQRVGLELLRKAVELEPRNVNYNIELARAYDELGMPSNAIRAFERVLHLDRKNSEATKSLKRLKK